MNTTIENNYIVLGISSNNVLEAITIEGYTVTDIEAYLIDHVETLKSQYPFIYDVLKSLLDIYKKQYKVNANVNAFHELLENSDEFSNNFIKIVESYKKNIINACNYYESTKKTISLKKPTLKISTKKEPEPEQEPPQDEDTTPSPVQVKLSTKKAIKPKTKISFKKKVTTDVTLVFDDIGASTSEDESAEPSSTQSSTPSPSTESKETGKIKLKPAVKKTIPMKKKISLKTN
jgi:hypothetical protein